MYSAAFAMTVILGIAVTNLFLGFATAILLGRGPKSWAELERAIVLQPVTLRGMRPARRPKVERVSVPLAAASPVEAPTPRNALVQPVEESGPPEDAAEQPAQAAADVAPVPQVAPSAVAPAPEKLMLPLRAPVDEHEHDSPEKMLGHQLETWRHGDLSDETPSMSGLKIHVENDTLEEIVRHALEDAIYGQIKGQVRKDRRVLRLGAGQFAWFSNDVPPEDALMPVERIRQLLASTRFQYQGEPVALEIAGGVVVGMPEDTPEGLLQRLRTALQNALERDEFATCLDTGAGTEGVDPYPIEVGETECELCDSLPVATNCADHSS